MLIMPIVNTDREVHLHHFYIYNRKNREPYRRMMQGVGWRRSF